MIIGRGGGGVEFSWKEKVCLKVSEMCEIKPQEGKCVHVDYGSQMSQPGEYLQPMLLNTIVERNLRESKFSPRAGNKKNSSNIYYKH